MRLRRQLSLSRCLVMLSEEAQGRSADLVFRKELEGSFQKLLAEVNASVDPHERLQFMTVVKDEWTIENSFLTPTLKLKRNMVEDTYKPMTDSGTTRNSRLSGSDRYLPSINLL